MLYTFLFKYKGLTIERVFDFYSGDPGEAFNYIRNFADEVSSIEEFKQIRDWMCDHGNVEVVEKLLDMYKDWSEKEDERIEAIIGDLDNCTLHALLQKSFTISGVTSLGKNTYEIDWF